MRGQDVVTAVFILILVYLVIVNYKGANQLLVSSGQALNGLIRNLQGR